jgi:SecD/SecF fusion protein
LFFGGQTLKDFAFALFVGVASGAYSSVFLAAPLVAVLKEREPRYQQLQVRAQARAARPGLRAVPTPVGPASVRRSGVQPEKRQLEPAARPARSVLEPEPSQPARPRPGGGAAKRKKPRQQGKPKRRRR